MSEGEDAAGFESWLVDKLDNLGLDSEVHQHRDSQSVRYLHLHF